MAVASHIIKADSSAPFDDFASPKIGKIKGFYFVSHALNTLGAVQEFICKGFLFLGLMIFRTMPASLGINFSDRPLPLFHQKKGVPHSVLHKRFATRLVMVLQLFDSGGSWKILR